MRLLRQLIFCGWLLAAIPASPAQPVQAPSAIQHVPDAGKPAIILGGLNTDTYPWFSGKTLPSNGELEELKSARKIAENDPKTIAAFKVYGDLFRQTEKLVVTAMLYSIPQEVISEQAKLHPLIHGEIWVVGDENSLDILLPKPNAGLGADNLEVLRFSGHAHTYFGDSSSFGIAKRAALSTKDVQISMQRLLQAYAQYSETIRAIMSQMPATKALTDKYPYLMYGRSDLGFASSAQSGL